MNNRGQFSIIAALLVAVVLVATVITTYSAIRYGAIQDQPQVLSAIDETNLALKQVLGFTVGYYGSVLRVTGNSSYAKALASNYLTSGLENIGDIRPEWGSSFNVTTLDLSTNWFTNTSYSAGHLVVKYDLSGLGIYGISYSASCRLDVQVSNSSSISQACLSIFKDEDEPLINLGKQNFKFYRYRYSNLTWEFVSPSGELTAFANGTYLIDIPSEIDSSSFVVQVEDTRGIMVAAASFSRITSTFMWNTTTPKGADYVDGSTVNVGTQSNFAAQQYGPDAIFDTLTEVNSPSTWAYSQDYVDANNTDIDHSASIGRQGNFTTQAYSDEVYDTLTEANVPEGATAIAKVGTDTNGTGNAMTLNFSHTLAAGANRLVVVCVGIENGGTIDVSGITYGGTAMTKANDALTGTSGIRYLTEVWYILEANLPANGARSVNITCSGTASSLEINGFCSEYTGVKQSAPEATASDVVTSDIRIINSTISPSAGAYVVSAVGCGNPGGYTHNASQVEVLDFVDSSSQFAVAELRSATAGTQGLSSTFSTTVNRQARVAASFASYPGTTNYRLDIEEQFTSATFNSEYEYLCVKTGALNGESLQLQVWNGSWNTLSAGLSASAWNNFSISSYLTSNTLYIRFLDGTQASDTSQSSWQIDSVLLQTYNATNYRLDLEEQWTNVDYNYTRQDLCIMTGNLSLNESLIVDIRVGSSWITVFDSLQSNKWNNVSVTPYISSQNLTIRFRDSSSDSTPDSWDIDAVLLSPQPDVDVLLSKLDHTIVVELLQNGTMRWLGQNLQLTTLEKPVPPVPVKAIRVNQTINGVNQEVPFQVEDWASEYRIPLGLTNNATVFGNRQMIVFLINVNVSKVTVWWNGSDMATQTPKAYTPTYFAGDDPNNNRLTNGNLTLEFGSSFTVKSTVGSTSSTANFMRINNEASTYGSGLAYVIHHGVVRDIVQQEAEWGTGGSGIGGADGCPNVYANIVLTLPAQATYYTCQLRLMFISSTQPRNITDLCPIKLTTSIDQLQTENGTINGIPIVTNGTGSFYNFTSGSWTAHHWSQFISGSQGAGIMFTNATNQQFYVFDSMAGNSVGALKVDNSTKTIELRPVARYSANFTYALDVTWHGAVATFDSTATTPIYTMQGTASAGLWILVEYQPTITVTSES